jgi:hypothetical protein
MGQIYSGGAAIGYEINVGNRWADFGLQLDVGGPRYTVGQQISPDVLPALDGTNTVNVSSITIASPGVVNLTGHGFTANMGVVFGGAGTLPIGLVIGTTYYVSATGLGANSFEVSATIGGAPINTTGAFAAPITVLPSYPGSFATVYGPSTHGHQWWVGELVRSDTITAGGFAHLNYGGSVALDAPGAWSSVKGYWVNGLNLAGATFSGTAIGLGAGQLISFNGASINGTAGTLGLSTLTTSTGGLYSNNYAISNITWADIGGSAALGFYGSAAVVLPVGYGTPTSVSKTASLAGTTATLAQVGGTLAALIQDLKSQGLIGG